jgi:hypothetical protein
VGADPGAVHAADRPIRFPATISFMDGNRAAYSLKAPGPSGASSPLRLPGRGSFPSIEDHLLDAAAADDASSRHAALP